MNILLALLLLFLGRRLHKFIRARWLRWLVLVPVFTATFMFVYINNLANAPQPEDEATTLAEQILEESQVVAGDLTVTVSATGAVQPARQVPLAFQLTAPVMTIYADEGEQVTEGQLLAELDNAEMGLMLQDAETAAQLQRSAFNALTSDPRDVDIAAAEAALQAARAQYSSALNTAPSQYQQEIARMQAELARNRRWQTQLQGGAIPDPQIIQGLNLPSQIDLDDATVTAIEGATGLNLPDPIVLGGLAQIDEFIAASNAQSIAAVETQRRQIQNALVGLEYGVQIADVQYQGTLNRGPDFGALSAANAQQTRARITLDRLLNGADTLQVNLANVDLELSELTLEQARFNLEQTRLYAPFDGLLVSNELTVGELPPQGAAYILMDTDAYYLDLPIDEVDIVKVKEGQRVNIEVDALPDAEITGEVVRLAYTPTVIGQVVTYTARVKLDPTDAPLRVGMTVTAQIVVAERDDVLLVPNRFIRIDRTTQTASVVVRDVDNTLRQVRVILGERNTETSEISVGLLEGQTVVLLPRETEGILD
jgi:HlyD family secretion protein